MNELSIQIASAWRSTSGIEILAAALAVAYLVLAIKQRRSCWIAAFVSSALYVAILFGARLYMDSALNAFYAAMAAYGYWQWTRGDHGHALQVSRWSLGRNSMAVFGVVCLSFVNAFFLRRYTPAAWPFVDSLLTWASVAATLLVARKVYENWHWWLVIDSVSVYLLWNRRLFVSALLFLLYLVMIVIGMREWRRSLAPTGHVAQAA